MTQVTFFSANGRLCGFAAQGHAGFAKSGEDIVCAGISAVLLTALTGITEVVGLKCRVVRRDSKGLLRVMLPQNADAQRLHEAQLALQIAKAGLEGMERQYPTYIAIDTRKWR